MKKLLFFALLVAGFSLTSQAQLKFYYYPSSNTYYDVSQKRYLYQNNGSWTPVTVLPATIRTVGRPRYIVYNQTPDVWIQNETHVKKYKAPKQKHYPQGKAYGYKGSNTRKGEGVAKGKGKNSKH